MVGGDWAAGVAALLAAIAMPRGPITTGQALAAMAGGALVGALAVWLPGPAGRCSSARWLTLAAFELGRVGADGPSVDGIHLDTPVACSPS